MSEQPIRMTHAELRSSLEWEGGIGALIECGIDGDEVPEDLHHLWDQAAVYYRDFLEVAEQIDEAVYRDWN